MIRLQVATLSDTANTREGLANILSAGVTNLRRPVFPAPIAATLVIVIEISDEFPGADHKIKIVLRKRGQAASILEVDAGIGGRPNVELYDDGTLPTATIPLIIALGGVMVEEPGRYEAIVEADGIEVGGTRFDVMLDPSIPAPTVVTTTDARPAEA